MKKTLLILCIFLISTVSTVYGKRLHYEKVYQDAWCEANGGMRSIGRNDFEWTLVDGSRADCVTEKFAIEFDFADKWAESVGQSALYSELLKRRAGIVLIMERGERDQVFLQRLRKALNRINGRRWANRTKIWTITPEDLKELQIQNGAINE